MAKGKAQAKQSRRATYPAAERLAKIVYGVMTRPHGWALSSLAAELDISERTLYRYLALLRKELVDSRGRPLFDEIRYGERRVLKLAEHAPVPESPTTYDVAFLYFALSVFNFLDGTVVKEGVEGLWNRFAKGLLGRDAARLREFPKKFYALPYAVKDYAEYDEVLDVIVQCLVYQHELCIDYAGLRGDGKEHVFRPYTLSMYRGGLYLIGKSSRGAGVITLAVERIRSAEKMPGRFEYPQGYSPEKYTEGAFGILFGATPARVEILVTTPETYAYLKSRRLHPTQRFRQRRDGKMVLSLTVRGTEELRNWILSFGPYLQVLKPRSLRDEVAAMHRSAARLYDRRAAAVAGREPGPA